MSLGAVFVVLMIGVAVVLGKAGASTETSASENVAPVIEGLQLYSSGALIGFDRILQDPNVVIHNWNPNRPFLIILNHLGGRFELPSLHAEYLTVGPHDLIDNVYTLYFAYIDFGYAGMLGFVLLVSFVVTLFYRKAMQRHPESEIVYSVLMCGLIVSIFNESLLTGWIMTGRLWAVCWLFYSLPAVWKRFQRFTARASTSAGLYGQLKGGGSVLPE